VNFLEVYSLPPFVRNRFTCLPYSFSVSAFHSLYFSRGSNLYYNIHSSICLLASSMQSSICRPPLMAVSRGPHMSQCTSCRGSVAQEVMGVKGFRTNLHLRQLLQLHLPVILRASVIGGKISTAWRPTRGKQQCHSIRFSASCRDAYPVILSASRQLSSISVYSVDS